MSASHEFNTPRPETRTRTFCLRLTPTQEKMLSERAADLGIGRADLVRAALDFYFAHAPSRRD